MKFILYIFVCCFFANTLIKSVANLSLDKDDLTEISADDSEDDTEEEEFDSKDLFSQEIVPCVFLQFDFDIKKHLLNISKNLYACAYFKNLSPPPDITV